MSATFALTPSVPSRYRARWLLVAIHIPFIAFVIAQGGLGLAFPPQPEYDWSAFALAAVASGLQLRHSLATAEGVRPRYWGWTLALLVAIAFVPAPALGSRWATMQWFVVASFAMLLPGRVAGIASVATAVGVGIWLSLVYLTPGSSLAQTVWAFAYYESLMFLGGAGLYGSTRLVRLMDQLHDARTDLAELAIGREHLRVSRDLHDLLGQSLSAVSLKGDLAISLLERDQVPRAIGEIESLVSVARTTLHDVRDIAHREPPIALASEIARATDLLASTGAETHVDVAVQDLPPAVEELFAWALREGVTNVLRHSAATTCSIRIQRHDGIVRLEIVNDGVFPGSAAGTGLTGLAARAATLAGLASGRAMADGRFRLRVDVPEDAR